MDENPVANGHAPARMQKQQRRKAHLIALAAGSLFAFAAEPIGIGGLLFLAPLFWLHAVETELTSPNLRRGAELGLSVGFGCHIVAFYWVVPLFTSHVPIPLPLAIFFAAIVWFGQALPFAFAGALTELLHASRLPRSLGLALSLPLGNALVWTMFPWRPAEIAVQVPAFAQMAELAGPAPLDFAIVLAGAGAYEALRSGRRWLLALAAFTFVAPTIYGMARIPEVEAMMDEAQAVRVGVVQPNVLQKMKFDARLAPSQLDNLRALTADVEREGIDFSVWPETSYPYPLDTQLERDFSGRRGVRYEGRVRSPILFGALTVGSSLCDHRNSAFAMDETGSIVGRADKVRLLPFSETIPFYAQIPILQKVFPCPGFQPGEGAQTLTLAGQKLGVLNCYEDLLPDHARLVALEQPAFFVNITNDGWFMNTAEPHLHHMATQLRAIESRRELLRVTNTGLSGRIDATGQRRESLPVWERSAMVMTMRVAPHWTTPFMRYGDLATPAILALAFLAILLDRAVRLTRTN